MVHPLPDHLAKRIPTGNTFHRYTGTVEFVQRSTGAGQTNFYLHPIKGEKETALEPFQMYVTDLELEKLNGQRVVLFAFVDSNSKVAFPMAYSRSTETWLMLHDMFKVLYVLESEQSGVQKVATGLLKGFLGASNVAMGPVNPLTGKRMAGPEVHTLFMDIRAHLVQQMEDAEDGGDGHL
jgi:hypothetical protein